MTTNNNDQNKNNFVINHENKININNNNKNKRKNYHPKCLSLSLSNCSSTSNTSSCINKRMKDNNEGWKDDEIERLKYGIRVYGKLNFQKLMEIVGGTRTKEQIQNVIWNNNSGKSKYQLKEDDYDYMMNKNSNNENINTNINNNVMMDEHDDNINNNVMIDEHNPNINQTTIIKKKESYHSIRKREASLYVSRKMTIIEIERLKYGIKLYGKNNYEKLVEVVGGTRTLKQIQNFIWNNNRGKPNYQLDDYNVDSSLLPTPTSLLIHTNNQSNSNNNNNDTSIEGNFVDTNQMMNIHNCNNLVVANSNSRSSSNQIIITGTWTDDEIVRFNNARRIYGNKDCKSIAKMVHTRNAIQVKLRCHHIRKGNSSSQISVPTTHHDDPLETTATTTTTFPLQQKQQQVSVQSTITQQQQHNNNKNISIIHNGDVASITNHETKNHNMDKYNVESVHNILAHIGTPTDNTEACNSMNEHSKHDFKSKSNRIEVAAVTTDIKRNSSTNSNTIIIGHNKGKWTKDEVELLDEAIRIYGPNAAMLSPIVRTRTTKQITDFLYQRKDKVRKKLTSSSLNHDHHLILDHHNDVDKLVGTVELLNVIKNVSQKDQNENRNKNDDTNIMVSDNNMDQLHDYRIQNNNNDKNITIEGHNNNNLVVRKNNSFSTSSSSNSNHIIMPNGTPWNDNEIVRLKNAIRIYGNKDYKSIATIVHTRSVEEIKKQCYYMMNGNNSSDKLLMTSSSSSYVTRYDVDPLLESITSTISTFPSQHQKNVFIQATTTTKYKFIKHHRDVDDDEENIVHDNLLTHVTATPTTGCSSTSSMITHNETYNKPMMNGHWKQHIDDATSDFKIKFDDMNCRNSSSSTNNNSCGNSKNGHHNKNNMGRWTKDELERLEEGIQSSSSSSKKNVKKHRHHDENILVSRLEDDDDDDEQHMMMICKGLWHDNDEIERLHDAV